MCGLPLWSNNLTALCWRNTWTPRPTRYLRYPQWTVWRSVSVTEEYRRFRVSESLKGSAEADEVVYAVWTAGYTEGIGADGSTEFFAYKTVALETGQEYVLFMHSLPVAPGYPTKYGDVVWTIVGEPGVAVVSSEGRLSFKASERYKNGVDNAGYERPVGSAAPFELTKAELIELIGGGGGGVVATGADSG